MFISHTPVVCLILFASAAKRIARASAITMILITRIPKGCFAFFDFLILTILQWLINEKMQYMPDQAW